MPRPLWFKPSQIAPATRVIARCKHCLSSRDLDVTDLPDIPMHEIERRLRCTDRGRDGKGPPCGHRAEIGIFSPYVKGADGMLEHQSPLR